MKAHRRRIERNKERILRATIELFKVQGIKKTTTNDIARQAGVSPATVYNHFSSKVDLVRAAVKYFLTSTAEDIRKITEGDLPFLGKIEQVISYKSEMLGQNQGELIQTILSEDPGIRQVVDSVYRDEITPFVIEFYEDGKRQGEINPELSTETIMRYFEIVRKGMAADSTISEDPEQNRKWLKEMTPILLYGIMGKPE